MKEPFQGVYVLRSRSCCMALCEKKSLTGCSLKIGTIQSRSAMNAIFKSQWPRMHFPRDGELRMGSFLIIGHRRSSHGTLQQKKPLQLIKCCYRARMKFITRGSLHTVDNQAVIHAWNNQGGRSFHVNNSMKVLFSTTAALNVLLHLFYVPFADNPADSPSRHRSSTDFVLTDSIW